MTKRIGELLSERTNLAPTQLDRALRLQQSSEERLGSLLVQLGLVAERDLAEALGEQLGLPVAPLQAYPNSPVAAGRVSPAFLQQVKAVPIAEVEDRVTVAMADPLDRYATDALRLALERPLDVQVGVLSEIENAIQRHYGDGESAMEHIVHGLGEGEEQNLDDIQHLRDLASEAPIIRLVNLLIGRALEARASDIHIEPFENELKVRYRIDGVLREVDAPPVRSTAAVVSRIKVMSQLNIAERRLPQDGRIKLRIEGREIDMRISTVPTLHGESVVMRILDKGAMPLDFQALGFHEAIRANLEEILRRPHGIVLVTGPTGSGKTTTLYAALELLNTPDRKVLTVEDPVEYQLDGINQIQVKPQIGLSFATALRSILRQDPDVIMVGEMRDLETAKIAVQSALTGHMVFSTLHTNDAPSSVTRLLDMGVDDFLVTSTVNGVVAQRLVRTLCEHCKEPFQALPEVIEELGLARMGAGPDVILSRGHGCPQCDGTGFRGRTTIVELLVMSDEVRRVVLNQGDAATIREAATRAGMVGMYDDGLAKALDGITSIEEVERVTREA